MLTTTIIYKHGVMPVWHRFHRLSRMRRVGWRQSGAATLGPIPVAAACFGVSRPLVRLPSPSMPASAQLAPARLPPSPLPSPKLVPSCPPSSQHNTNNHLSSPFSPLPPPHPHTPAPNNIFVQVTAACSPTLLALHPFPSPLGRLFVSY